MNNRRRIAAITCRTPVISAGTAANPNNVFARNASSTSIHASIASVIATA
ncbi:hypothetical protein ACE1SV_68830 [Streptomyces sp. E-15]